MQEDDSFLSRYSRQIVLPEIGGEGQKRLLNSSVLVVGAGGLGTPILQYLCGAGVGQLTVFDHDRVEQSNLQRQPLFRTGDIGKPKATVAAEALEDLNPDCTIEPVTEKLTEKNVDDAVQNAHLVVEGSDDFHTKFRVNDACLRQHTPMVLGGILRHTGQVLSVLPQSSPCYRCLFESPPAEDSVPDCSEAGVLGPLAGTVGSMQAYEVLKILLGFGRPLFDRLIELKMDRSSIRYVDRYKNSDCPACQTSTNNSA